jgi:hypothetical protein
MFGVIDLDSDRNSGLQEKAGREGFRENRAYRHFRGVLKNFFAQLAAEFFAERGQYSDIFRRARDETRVRATLLREREERVRQKRDRFARRVGHLIEEIEGNEPQQRVEVIVADLRGELERLVLHGDSEGFSRAEGSAQARLGDLRAEYRIVRPTGFGLGDELVRNVAWLEEQLEGLTPVWDGAERTISSAVSEAARRAHSAPTALAKLSMHFNKPPPRSATRSTKVSPRYVR